MRALKEQLSINEFSQMRSHAIIKSWWNKDLPSEGIKHERSTTKS